MIRLFVQCEIGLNGLPIRIFKHAKDALESLIRGIRVEPRTRQDAVLLIREQVWEKDKGLCRTCAKKLTWGSAEMDEIVSKGRLGEVSVKNCQMLCHECHVKKHNRVPKFTKRSVK